MRLSDRRYGPRGVVRLVASAITLLVLGAGAVTVVATPAQASSINGPITRDEILDRAQNWVDRGLTYTQDQSVAASDEEGTHKYRRDCSGLVSMVWHLNKKSDGWDYNTDDFLRDGNSMWFTLGSINEFQPGDAMVRDGHMELFAFWASSSDHSKGAYVYSFNQTGETVRNPYRNSNMGNLGKNTWTDLQSFRPIRRSGLTAPTPPPAPPASGVSGDFNGDNKDDVLARSGSTDELFLYPGTGSFTTDRILGSSIRVGTGWGQYDRLVSGDYNNDGKSDVIARKAADGTLWVYTGTGSFTTDRVLNFPPVRVGTGWNQFDAIFSGDFNQDGKSDVVARRAADEILVLYPGTGALVTDAVLDSSIRIGVSWGRFDVFTSGDFNQDGKSDIVGRATDGVLWLYPGTGSFTTDHVVDPAIPIGYGWNSMNALTAGDFNQDGKSDVVSRKSSDDTLWMYPGTGSFTSNRVLSSPARVGTGWGGFDRIS
ncbi:FG-GAP repeat domain-containing protein [Micromonospora sp. CA-240977]|uniref:FG-GAP repeat domain-containing protein n=1 Tax=Micromonospora sp. CA-240977 TaxID=3239957 RepID=UPI003D9081E4